MTKSSVVRASSGGRPLERCAGVMRRGLLRWKIRLGDKFRVQDNSRHGLTLRASLIGQGPDLANGVIEHGRKTAARLLERIGRDLRTTT
jgi:hypothetical protein